MCTLNAYAKPQGVPKSRPGGLGMLLLVHLRLQGAPHPPCAAAEALPAPGSSFILISLPCRPAGRQADTGRQAPGHKYNNPWVQSQQGRIGRHHQAGHHQAGQGKALMRGLGHRAMTLLIPAQAGKLALSLPPRSCCTLPPALRPHKQEQERGISGTFKAGLTPHPCACLPPSPPGPPRPPCSCWLVGWLAKLGAAARAPISLAPGSGRTAPP